MNAVKVKTIKPIGVANVVDLTVEKNHTFVTGNGVVVHNCNSTQPALRNFMDEFSKNCGFIMTCNYVNRIIEPLQSRCSIVDFKILKSDAPKLAGQFFKRVSAILDLEGVNYDKAVVAEVINKHYPDWRRVLNELQRYSATGTIDSGILVNLKQASIKELIVLMKDRNYSAMRNWVSNNVDGDTTAMYRGFYDNASDYFTPNSIPPLVLSLAKYQYQAAFSADAEINFMAFLTEVMIECEFKRVITTGDLRTVLLRQRFTRKPKEI